MKTDQIRVFLDNHPLISDHAFRGVGNYTRNLIIALEKHSEVKLVSFNDQPDIVHYPYFDFFYASLPIWKKYPTVVTIHDATPLVFPKHYPPGLKGKVNFTIQKFLLKKVDMVITDSNSSKNDIIRYLQYPADKIRVIYLAAGSEFRCLPQSTSNNGWERTIRKKYRLPDRYVIYVGDVGWNKNILSLVKAVKKVGLRLLIVGKQAAETNTDFNHPENQPFKQLLENYGEDPAIIRLGWVDEEDLIKLYNLALVCCQPSYYEGFGLWILQAMACGCPVITSQLSSCPEVAGKAAILVDPYSVNAIAAAIDRVTKDVRLRSRMKQLGFDQVKKFTWEKTSQKTFEVYCSLIK